MVVVVVVVKPFMSRAQFKTSRGRDDEKLNSE